MEHVIIGVDPQELSATIEVVDHRNNCLVLVGSPPTKLERDHRDRMRGYLTQQLAQIEPTTPR